MNEEDFERLITSWINGNKSWVYKKFKEMNISEKEDFIEYVTDPDYMFRFHADTNHRISILKYLLIREM